MKVLTIKQPWASLIALEEKRFETRSWKTKHRGELAIHAGKSIDKKAYKAFSDILAKYGINCVEDLPTGSIIATVNVVDCHQVVQEDVGVKAKMDSDLIIENNEYQFGVYTEGHYAWELNSVHKFAAPVAAKGQLNLWNWNPTE